MVQLGETLVDHGLQSRVQVDVPANIGCAARKPEAEGGDVKHGKPWQGWNGKWGLSVCLMCVWEVVHLIAQRELRLPFPRAAITGYSVVFSLLHNEHPLFSSCKLSFEEVGLTQWFSKRVCACQAPPSCTRLRHAARACQVTRHEAAPMPPSAARCMQDWLSSDTAFLDICRRLISSNLS